MIYNLQYATTHIHAGDMVCFIAAAREFARRTGNIACVNFGRDLVEAYGDDNLRYGGEGVKMPVAVDRLYDTTEQIYKNYMGMFYASMGILRDDEIPRLELPPFEKTESIAIIQPFSISGISAPVEYVQSIVDTFKSHTGKELYVVGSPETPKILKNVNYELLRWGIVDVMKIVASSSFVLTIRSLTAHLAAGFQKPTFIWCPPDGKNWHLNYPDWECNAGIYNEGTESVVSRLEQFLMYRQSGMVSQTEESKSVETYLPDIKRQSEQVYTLESREGGNVEDKICLLTGYDDMYANVGNLTAYVNNLYCFRRGYEHKICRYGFDVTRPMAWSKILFIRQTLLDYKWVLWVDADAMVTNHDIKIETFMQNGGDVFICRDLPTQPMFNTGVMLFRHCDFTLKLLDAIWNHTKLAYDFHGDQKALVEMYETGNLNGRLVWYDTRAFNSPVLVKPETLNGEPKEKYEWVKGDYVAHCSGLTIGRKLSEMIRINNLCKC